MNIAEIECESGWENTNHEVHQNSWKQKELKSMLIHLLIERFKFLKRFKFSSFGVFRGFYFLLWTKPCFNEMQRSLGAK